MIEKNEIKTKRNNENLIDETKLQGELIILKAKEMEPVTKIESVPFPTPEETSAEAPMEAIAESELLPTLTKEGAPIGMEPPTAVSMEDSFQPPTIHDKEDLKDDTIPLVAEPYKPDIEKIRAEETRRIKDIARDTKEIEISKYKDAERDATIEGLTNNKLRVNLVTNGKTIISTDEGEPLVVPKMEKEEVISNHIERNGREEKDIPTEREIVIAETEKVGEMLPVIIIEEFVEKSEEISQLDETKTTDIKETVPHMEIIRMNEIVEVPSVSKIEEIEQKEKVPVVDVIEVKEITPEVISPTVDIIKVEKFEPDKFPVVDVEKVPIEKKN